MRIEKYIKTVPVGLLILLALFIGSLFLFGVIIHEVLWEKELEADNQVFGFMSTYVVNDGLTEFMKFVTYFASARFLQVAYGVLILFYLLKRKWREAVETAAIGIGGFVVNFFMKTSFQRVRPPNPMIEGLQNFSFPSGHATSGFIFYGLLAYLVWKSGLQKPYKYFIISLLISFSILIGLSRVYLRVHYASDVLAGFCIGFAWLLLSTWLFNYLKSKN